MPFDILSNDVIYRNVGYSLILRFFAHHYYQYFLICVMANVNFGSYSAENHSSSSLSETLGWGTKRRLSRLCQTDRTVGQVKYWCCAQLKASPDRYEPMSSLIFTTLIRMSGTLSNPCFFHEWTAALFWSMPILYAQCWSYAEWQTPDNQFSPTLCTKSQVEGHNGSAAEWRRELTSCVKSDFGDWPTSNYGFVI